MSEFSNADEQPILSMEEENFGYEVISSDEVDRVVATIEELMTRVQSENIRSVLDECADEIYGLVYTDAMNESEAHPEAA